MGTRTEIAAQWIYNDIWKVLVDFFRVPNQPPSLPAKKDEQLNSFKPSTGFLRYMKFWFWLVLALTDIGFLILYIIGAVALWQNGWWWAAILLALPTLILIVVPDIIAYIAIHLRYDTTWYVMTERSLRIRRGIWIIHETTITFENVQNLKVQQGPLQRIFRISNLIVETAGSGGSSDSKHSSGVSNRGIIEGITNAQELRDRILSRVRATQTAGLGDEEFESESGHHRWSQKHIAVLREIRDEIGQLAVS